MGFTYFIIFPVACPILKTYRKWGVSMEKVTFLNCYPFSFSLVLRIKKGEGNTCNAIIYVHLPLSNLYIFLFICSTLFYSSACLFLCLSFYSSRRIHPYLSDLLGLKGSGEGGGYIHHMCIKFAPPKMSFLSEASTFHSFKPRR